MRLIFIFLLLLFHFQAESRQKLNVAVASNFYEPIKTIKKLFEKKNQVELIIVKGSTSHLYAQIVNGAPIDVFLSADQKTPKKLHKNLIIPKTQFTYAVGKIVFWTNNTNSKEVDLKKILTKNKINVIALANPKFSPYGEASFKVLKKIGVFSKLQNKIVLANNINQVASFLYSGNADGGFISFSDRKKFKSTNKGVFVDIPEKLCEGLKQDAVLLYRGKKNIYSEIFFQFLKSSEVKKTIKSFGYKTEN